MKEEILLDKLIFLSIENELAISDNLNKLIKEISKDEFKMIVPVTSMSKSEYGNLNLEKHPRYALCCNGAILLKDDVVDEEWYKESLKLAEKCQWEFDISKIIFNGNKDIVSDVQFIDNIFLRAKCDEPEEVITTLLGTLYHSDVDILDIEKQIYVIPKALDKGKNTERFIDYLKEKEGYYIDSTCGIGINFLDQEMLEKVNYVFVSNMLNENNFIFSRSTNYSFDRFEGKGDFGEWILNKL